MKKGDKYLVFIVFLVFLFFIGLGISEFTGFSIYDPEIQGNGTTKNAVWGFYNSSNYNYSNLVSFSSGNISLIKPVGFLHEEFTSENSSEVNLTNNDIRLDSINGSYSVFGYYISDVYDAGYNSSLWSNISWDETLNNQSVNFSYRVGNTLDGWVDSGDAIEGVGRYFQYRVELSSDGNQTPILDNVKVETKYFTEGFIETEFLNISNLHWILDGNSSIYYNKNNIIQINAHTENPIYPHKLYFYKYNKWGYPSEIQKANGDSSVYEKINIEYY